MLIPDESLVWARHVARAQHQCDAVHQHYQAQWHLLQRHNMRLRAALVIQYTARIWAIDIPSFPRPESAPVMCMQTKPTISWAPEEAASTEKPVGSLRRKIWNLPAAAQCPVIGVCLPMARLQILLKKAGHQINHLSHYQQHQLAVGECRHHTRLAEIVQRDLDAQFDLTLKILKPIKDESQLIQRWFDDVTSGHWAATFWALLTHPHMSDESIDRLIGDVHMLQHQVGMTSRNDQLQTLKNHKDKQDLKQQIQALQERLSKQQEHWSSKQIQLEQQLVDANTRMVQVTHEHAKLQTLLAQSNTPVNAAAFEALKADNVALRKELALYERALRKETAQPSTGHEPSLVVPNTTEEKDDKSWQWLQSPKPTAAPMRSVMCVGGATSQVPAYREVVVSKGVEFIHHDGGIEHKITRLELYLAQADLVICQTGCISHNAYWKVKEHCKRHGKPCAFVGSPSPQAVKQVLESMQNETQTSE